MVSYNRSFSYEREREREREISHKTHDSLVSIIGHYVPQLAQLIIQFGLKFNLKGIAVSRTCKL